MKITNRKRNILLILIIIFTLSVGLAFIFNDAFVNKPKAELMYKEELDRFGIDKIFEDERTMQTYADNIAEKEYQRLANAGVPEIQFYYHNELVNYPDEYLEMHAQSNTSYNIYSCSQAIISYIAVAKLYGMEYFRDTVIAFDDKLELEYYFKLSEIMQRYIDGDRDFLTQTEFIAVGESVFARYRHLTDEDVLTTFNDEIYPILEEFAQIMRTVNDPEKYPEVGYYPLSPYVNIAYRYDDEGNLYDAQLKLDIERFGYKPGVKVD